MTFNVDETYLHQANPGGVVTRPNHNDELFSAQGLSQYRVDRRTSFVS